MIRLARVFDCLPNLNCPRVISASESSESPLTRQRR